MKKQLALCLAFVVMLISSCQKDPNIGQVGQDGMVDFSITTSLPKGPDAYTRAAANPNSALGGLANVNQAEYDLRYIMEVWTIGESPKRVHREVTTVDIGWAATPATFDVRLIAQKYNFVFWADFVYQSTGGTQDLHYITTSLDNIEFTEYYNVSDDTRDAYFHKEEIDLSVSTNKFAVSLKRPFAKVRFIATDRPQNDNSVLVPTSSTIDYSGAVFYTEFNATTGLAMGIPSVREQAYLLTATPKPELAVDSESDYLLVFDYILPGTLVTSIGESSISTLIDDVTASRPNLPSIPIVANTLVTLKGNLYSNRGVVTVNVTDAFEEEEKEVPVADIEAVKSIENVNDIIKRLADENATAKNPIGVKVEAAITENAMVSIPETILAAEIPAITYDISSGIQNDKILTVASPTYAGTINVIVPETNTGSVTIDAPFAHVSINGTYTNLSAATSATTLVLEKGATVVALTITEGNADIYGDVTTLNNDGSGDVNVNTSSAVTTLNNTGSGNVNTRSAVTTLNNTSSGNVNTSSAVTTLNNTGSGNANISSAVTTLNNNGSGDVNVLVGGIIATLVNDGTGNVNIYGGTVKPTINTTYYDSENGYDPISKANRANSYILPIENNIEHKISIKRIDDYWGNTDAESIYAGNDYQKTIAANWIFTTVIWADFNHERSVSISVNQAETSMSITTKDIKAINSGNGGNMVVAATSQYGEVLWSWHIWFTDMDANFSTRLPGENNFDVMDRNLGALSQTNPNANPYGLLYQWGRKDPFQYMPVYYFTSNDGSIKNAIANPQFFYTSTGPWISRSDWVSWINNSPDANAYDSKRWNNVPTDSYDIISKGGKTIFDPSPRGWRVFWGRQDGLNHDNFPHVNKYYIKGREYNNDVNTFFPASQMLLHSDGYLTTFSDHSGNYWSGSSYFSDGLCFSYHLNEFGRHSVGRAYGYSVRPVREE